MLSPGSAILIPSEDEFQRSTEAGQGAKLSEEDVKGLIKAREP